MFKSSIILKNFFGRGSLCSTTAQTKVTQPWPVNRCVAHHQRMTVACMMSQTLSLGENEKERHWASRSWHWGSLPSMTIDNCHASRPHPRILQAPAQCSVWLKAWGRLLHPALCTCCARYWCLQSGCACLLISDSSLFLNHLCPELMYLGLTWHLRGWGMGTLPWLRWPIWPGHLCMRTYAPWERTGLGGSGAAARVALLWLPLHYRPSEEAIQPALDTSRTCAHSEKLVLLEAICRPHLKLGKKPKFSLPRYLYYL